VRVGIEGRRNETEKIIGDQKRRIRTYTQYLAEAYSPGDDCNRLWSRVEVLKPELFGSLK
jgi:hypothetical protein